MKVKDLLEVVDKDYLDCVKIYTNNYDIILEWVEWDNNVLEKYYSCKVNSFTWCNEDLRIAVED